MTPLNADRIMTIDPGPSTGLATWSPRTDPMPFSTTLPRIEAEDFIAERIKPDGTGATLVIIESFIISMATAKKSRAGSESIEMIGMTRYLCRIAGIPLIESRPADVMRFATDDKLRRIGWYVTGPDHARDALRHLLTFAAETSIIDPAQLLRR